jgi:hypothetical protein
MLCFVFKALALQTMISQMTRAPCELTNHFQVSADFALFFLKKRHTIMHFPLFDTNKITWQIRGSVVSSTCYKHSLATLTCALHAVVSARGAGAGVVAVDHLPQLWCPSM